jgi:hypothetical protein
MCVDRVATWSVSMSDDFDNADNRLKDVKGEPMLLKLMVQIGIKVWVLVTKLFLYVQDWLSNDDFTNFSKHHVDDFINALPMQRSIDILIGVCIWLTDCPVILRNIISALKCTSRMGWQKPIYTSKDVTSSTSWPMLENSIIMQMVMYF